MHEHIEERVEDEGSLSGPPERLSEEPADVQSDRIALPQGGYVMNPGVKDALYRVARFTLSQGAYPHFEQLALALTSRLYQALNLVPDSLSQALIKEANLTTESQRMLMSVELAGRLSSWLSQRFKESQLSDLLQGVLWAMSASEGRLHSLLTALNLEVLAPLKVKLNPRKWIEAEERMGAALYQACLLTEPSDDSPALPTRAWPDLPEYDLLICEPAHRGIHRFFAVRQQDQLRCWVYFSEELSLGPKLSGAWPAQYMAPLEWGEWRGLKWVSVPSVSSVCLKDIFPYLDTYCALSASEQALEVLAALHHQGVSHLDFRPEHLVIDHRLQVRALPNLTLHSAERTWRGRTQLTPTPWSVYVSPEQREGGEGDTRSDLWSYGALLFELFQGRPLIEVTSWDRLPAGLVASGEHPLRSGGLWIPEGLQQLVTRCVCDNPDERWADARLVLEAFRPIAQEIRSELKSQGRSAQWSRLIAEGHLLNFVEAEVSARLRGLEGEHEPTPNPELITERLIAYLDDAEVALSSAEEPSTLLTELTNSAYELQENLIEWQTIQSEAELARVAMIERIERREAVETFNQLQELLSEKELIIEALEASTSRIEELHERRPRVFYERLQRFIDQEELEISLERLVGVHVESNLDLKPAQASRDERQLEPVAHTSEPELEPSSEPSALEEPSPDVEQDWYDAIEAELSVSDELPALEELSEVAPASAWLPQEPVPDFDDLSRIDQPDPVAQSIVEVSGIEFDDELTGLDQLESELQGPRDPFAASEPWAPAPQLSVTSGGLYQAEEERFSNTDERLASLEESPLETEELFGEEEGSPFIDSEGEGYELRPTPSMLPIHIEEASYQDEPEQEAIEQEPIEQEALEQVAPEQDVPGGARDDKRAPERAPSAPELLEETEELRSPDPESLQPHELLTAFQSPEEIKQVRVLYERFLTLKIEHDEPIDDISFEGFLEEINQAYTAYVATHGAQAFKFSVHYRKGRVMLRARPVSTQV